MHERVRCHSHPDESRCPAEDPHTRWPVCKGAPEIVSDLCNEHPTWEGFGGADVTTAGPTSSLLCYESNKLLRHLRTAADVRVLSIAALRRLTSVQVGPRRRIASRARSPRVHTSAAHRRSTRWCTFLTTSTPTLCTIRSRSYATSWRSPQAPSSCQLPFVVRRTAALGGSRPVSMALNNLTHALTHRRGRRGLHDHRPTRSERAGFLERARPPSIA